MKQLRDYALAALLMALELVEPVAMIGAITMVLIVLMKAGPS